MADSPQSFVVDQAATFTTVRLLGCGPKLAYQSERQETAKDGTPKWEAEVIAGFRSFGRESKAILRIGVTSNTDPGNGIGEFTPVELIGFQVGVMPSERRNKETGQMEMVGVKIWYRADEIRATSATNGRKGE